MAVSGDLGFLNMMQINLTTFNLVMQINLTTFNQMM
jgi:hypothetical protein